MLDATKRSNHHRTNGRYLLRRKQKVKPSSPSKVAINVIQPWKPLPRSELNGAKWETSPTKALTKRKEKQAKNQAMDGISAKDPADTKLFVVLRTSPRPWGAGRPNGFPQ